MKPRLQVQRIALAVLLVAGSAWPAASYKLYVVFFGAQSSGLVPEAKMVVEEAVEAYRVTQPTGIHVIGRRDGAEAAQATTALALHRALIVKQELIRLGIAAEKIAVSVAADDDQFVPQAPGAQEPQNRCVTIDLLGMSM